MNITKLNIRLPGSDQAVLEREMSDGINVFLGPRGCGKSDVRRHLAWAMFGDCDPSTPFDRRSTGHVGFALHSSEPSTPIRDGDPAARRLKPLANVDLSHWMARYSVDFASDMLHAFRNRDSLSHVLHDFDAGDHGIQTSAACHLHRNVSHTARQDDAPRLHRLLNRRDELTKALERRVSENRRDNLEINRDLASVMAGMGKQSDEIVELKRSLRQIDERLRELEVALRRRKWSLEQSATIPLPPSDADKLEFEIQRCRESLLGSQARQRELESHLAACEANRVSTAEAIELERTCLAGIEQLLTETRAELAAFGDSATCPHCLGEDAEARVAPLLDLIRERVYAICNVLSQQQRAVHRDWQEAELRQHHRCQTALFEQIELLERRRHASSHHHTSAQLQSMILHDSQHCGCQEHDAYIRDSHSLPPIATLETELHELRQRRDEVIRSLRARNESLQNLQARRDTLQRELAVGAADQDLVEIQRELLAVQEQLADELRSDRTEQPRQDGVADAAIARRASDYLHRMTSGELCEIDIRAQRGRGVVWNQRGERIDLQTASDADRAMVRLSVALAYVDDHHDHDIDLPLLLDDPFLPFDPSHTSRIAQVLHEFASRGRQLIVFTANADAAARLESWGAVVHRMPERAKSIEPERPLVVRASHPPETKSRVQSVVVRKPLLPTSPIEDLGLRDKEAITLLRKVGIHEVADLMHSDPSDVAAHCDDPSITESRVRQWQACAILRCYVSELSASEAAVLAACGVVDLDQLADADVDDLRAKVHIFLNSEQGRRSRRGSSNFDRADLQQWVNSARLGRERWLEDRRSFHRAPIRTSVQNEQIIVPLMAGSSDSIADKSQKSRRRSKGSRRGAGASRNALSSRAQVDRRSNPAAHKFYLETNSPVVDAPSIGPRMAQRLKKIGIVTVQDLLQADTESAVAELDHDRTNVDTFRQWQQQARLMCQIPQLRGHDAQILVACGFTEPEEVAATSPKDLLALVEPFVETKEGERILRGGQRPDLNEVTDWIDWASSSRRVDAA